MCKEKKGVPLYDKLEFDAKKSSSCICIPVINEGDRILSQLKRMKAAGIPNDFDIIICDGGSSDGSMDESKIEELGVNTLLTKKSKGKLSAQLRMGYWFALNRGYERIITIDGNNKDSVESVYEIENSLKNYDFVQGSRFVQGGQAINTPMIRHLAVKIIHVPMISMFSGYKYSDTTNGFRGYNRTIFDDKRVSVFREVFDSYELLAYLSVRLPKLGYSVTEVPVTRTYPSNGEIPTKISSFKGNLTLMKILFSACLGRYNPRKEDE